MKHLSLLVFCCSAAMLHAGVWTPDLTGRTLLSKENTPKVVSGSTEVAKDGSDPVLKFSRTRPPAVFQSTGILDSESGRIEFSFKPNIPDAGKPLHSNYIFSSGSYSLGYNTSPKGCAVFFLTKTTSGKPAGVYKMVTLENGRWHRMLAHWTKENMALYLDGKFLASSGRGGSVFGDTFRIGSDGWGFSDCLIRDFRIASGESAKTALTPANAQMPSTAVKPTAVVHTEIAEEVPFPYPFCAVGKNNLLGNADFALQEAVTPAQKKLFAAKKFQLKTPRFPVNWSIETLWFQPPATQGSFALREMTKPDGKKGFYAVCEMPENKWNTVDFLCRRKFPLDPIRRGEYYAGFWGRGDGTVTVRIYESVNGKRTGTIQESFLMTDKWKFYRTGRILPKSKNAQEGNLAFTVYGIAELAMPEIAEMPAVDKSAELTFYVPFDNGSAEALFSVGQTGVMGPGERSREEKGIAGGAYRIDRKRRLTDSGFLRYPIGLTYECMENIIDREEGTIEMWLRPLPEMLTTKRWMPFYLFLIGATSYVWPAGTDFDVYFEREKTGALNLVTAEHVKVKEWPTQTRIPNSNNQVVRRYRIPDSGDFVGKWHHFAFTYDDTERVIYLDGKPVIRFAALKKPAFMNRDTLFFGTNHLTTPFLASCDFDELKIYRGVKYRGEFAPSPKALAFRMAAEKNSSAYQASSWKIGKPEREGEGRRIVFPVTHNGTTYRLALSLGDGYPLIFSSKDAAMRIHAKYHPAIPDLVPENVTFTADTASGRVPRRDTAFSWSVTEKNGVLEILLDLDKKDGFWTAYLEPRISLERPAPWGNNFDGFTTRPVLTPFRAFAFESQMLGLPMSAAWQGDSGMVLALSPETIVSYLRHGMNRTESIDLAVRTVLDKGERMRFRFEVIPFHAKYGADSAVDAYHAVHPDFFRRDPAVDPRVYGNIGITNTWNTPSFAERSKKFSIQEINRRMRGSWCWYYSSGLSTGNWEPDMEVLRELANLNNPHVANARFNARIHQRSEYREIDERGVLPAPYISAWTEKRFTRYFSDSVYDDRDIPNGINFIHSYWWRDITDYPVIQTGTRYGEWLRSQIRGIFEHYPQISAFSHDELVGNYFFRKHNTMGGSRAFDEDGVYTHHMAAMGALLRDIIATPNQTGFKSAVNSNARIQSSGYNAMFRTSNNIFERPIHWALQDWGSLRQHTRMMGEKSSTFYPHHAFVGNYFTPEKEDPRMMRYFLIGYNKQQLLAGLLFNVQMNYNILGVRETVENLDELNRAHSLGYRQVSAVKTSPGILAVRYGEPGYGLIGLVNASHLPREAALEIDSAYLKHTPILCAGNAAIRVKGGKTGFPAVAPLSWQLVEMAGTIPGGKKEYDYTSKLETNRNGRILTLTFDDACIIPRLDFGLYPFEELRSIVLNGRNLETRRDGSRICTPGFHVKKGDTLVFSTKDRRWLSDARGIADFPYLKNGELEIVCQGANALIQGRRIAEFFRFWTVNQADGKAFAPPVAEKASGAPDRLRVLVEESDSFGISLHGKSVILRGKGRALADLTDEFLALLDTKFPYYGYYGEQTPMLPWDYTSTSEQRRLQEKTQVVGKTLSVKTAVTEFNQWLKESGADVHEGF